MSLKCCLRLEHVWRIHRERRPRGKPGRSSWKKLGKLTFGFIFWDCFSLFCTLNNVVLLFLQTPCCSPEETRTSRCWNWDPEEKKKEERCGLQCRNSIWKEACSWFLWYIRGKLPVSRCRFQETTSARPGWRITIVSVCCNKEGVVSLKKKSNPYMCVLSPGSIMWVGNVSSVGQIQVQVASAFSVFCAFIFPKGLVHFLSMITFFSFL